MTHFHPLKRFKKFLTKIFPSHLVSSQGHWFYLFHALILLLVLYPYLEKGADTHRPWLLVMLNSAVTLTIIWTVSFNRTQFAFAFLLGLPALILNWLPWAKEYTQLISCTSSALLYAYAIVMLIPYLLQTPKVGSEEIYGATSLYIILGLLWAVLYQAIEFLYPGSFYIHESQNIDWIFNWSDLLFFSFTTLTTLGYGDITPVTSQARSLAILEAITGVIFLGIILSRAVGLYVSQYISRLQK